MPYLFLNELTVNGRPVDEDELEDDYTADTNTEDENDDESSNNQDDTLDLGDDTEGGNNNDTGDTDDTSDTDDDLDADYTAQAQAEEDSNDNNSEDGNADDVSDNSTDDASDTSQGDNNDSSDGDNNDLDLSDSEETEGNDEQPDEGSDTNGDDSSTDDSVDNNDSDSNIEEKIKQTEAEIFNTLSDNEKAIKNRELIDNYIDLKKTIKLFLEKVRTITITAENSQVLHFVEINLVELENIITDYIIDRYNTKSYIENFIFYQQIILTISQIKDIISKINTESHPQK